MSEPYSPIVILDSGIGGLPYLERVRDLLPEASLIYIADTKHFPYGTKPQETIVADLTKLADAVSDRFDPLALVLACNTASVVALSALRNRFDIPIVGVVPAVKPAGTLSANRRIGLLATNRTVLDSYTEALITDFAPDCHVERVGDGEIVRFVEYDYLEADAAARRSAVEEAARRFAGANVDAVVLGCTHFVFIRDELADQLPKDVSIVDSRDGVAYQVVRVTEATRRKLARANVASAPSAIIYVTEAGVHENRYRAFAVRFRCTYGGELP